MARELDGDMLRSRRMAGEIGQHGVTLSDSSIAIVLTEDRLRPRLVHARMKQKFAAVLRIEARIAYRPAGDNLGEIRHIFLIIARAHAQRMQFENFAGEIFIWTPRTDDAPD